MTTVLPWLLQQKKVMLVPAEMMTDMKHKEKLIEAPDISVKLELDKDMKSIMNAVLLNVRNYNAAMLLSSFT